MFEKNLKETFPEREARILEFWKHHAIPKKAEDIRKSSKLFSLYDGPPFATGLPHYGHLLAGTIKDVIPRYKTMQGFYVPRRFGWDCHGLPVENEIEKAKELSGAPSIEAFGIANFNEECRKIVLRYTQEWEKTVHRMGRWMDFSKTYKTMDKGFMESVWWVFGQLYEKGLVYEGFKVMPFSAKLGTPLSNFEANLNYKDVDDPSLTVKFQLKEDPNTFVLAWTTTPWTLPSNLALSANPELEYVKIQDHKTGHNFILAKARLSSYFKEEGSYTLVKSFSGKELKGKKYEPLFPYFAKKAESKAFQILTDEFVGSEDGTGVVHTAPAFGEADFFVCAKEGIEIVCPVDQNGRFTHEIPEYQDMFVKDADKEIIARLKKEGKVFQHSQVHHRYPFCWRSDTPLIYKAVSTWFVAVEKIKERMLAANDQILWVPDNIKEGRFGKWLENARDWAVSRNRYWGTPIPIWRCEQTGEIRVFSSIAELENKVGSKIEDLHRHFVDDLTFEEDGKVFKRVPEVFDCWFESGSMPYAQNHYPFENEELTLKSFPADFIAEGLDQTRGWFYTLTVLAVALFDKPAFKNVIVNGIILAEDGAKMSKRLKNYPDPELVMERYGADAIRLYLLSSPVVQAEDLKFSERGVELVMRQVLIPLWNSYVFLATYAEIYNWHPSELSKPKAEVDRWILSLLQKLIKDVTESMDRYELSPAVQPFIEFIDQLTNWYIRRSRGRFWSEEDSEDRREAFAVLYHVIKTLSKIAAPFIPFICEEIYLKLRKESDPESVHLCDFPKYNAKLRDENLEKETESVQQVVSAAHALRKEHKLKVRQPLALAHLVCSDPEISEGLKRHENLIAEEINVKEIIHHDKEEAFVTLFAKPNFRVLGKKVGKWMNAVHKEIEKLDRAKLKALLKGESIKLSVEGETFEITPEDVAVERKVKEGLVAASVKEVTIALDTQLNEDLLLEGIAREIVNKVNTMRRELGFAVVDRIRVTMETTERVRQSFSRHQDYICHEILASRFDFAPCIDGTEWDLNGEPAKITIAHL